MLLALQMNGEFFTSHFIVVVFVALAFFIIQVGLAASVWLRAHDQQRLLRRLLEDFKQSGSGRDFEPDPDQDLSWIQWVFDIFPPGSPTVPVNYSREDALHELDTRLASSSDYLLLQRMGIMAPLLGVVLTVAGFYWLRVEEFNEQSLSSILLAVSPLISGVGAGALLALVNQGLLHVASRRLESLRMAARSWFDNVVWSQIDVGAHGATNDAARALKQFAGSIQGASEQYAASGAQLRDTVASIREAAIDFNRVFASFKDEIREIPAALGEVRRSTAGAAAALEELIHIGSRAVSNLDVSVAAFRTALDRDFTPAAELHHRASRIMAESAQQVGDTTARLKSSTEQLKRSVDANAESCRMMDESIRQHLVPGNRRFYDTAQDVASQTTDLLKGVRAIAASAQDRAREFDGMASGLAGSVSSFNETIDKRLSSAVAKYGRQIESADRVMQRLDEMGENISEGTALLSKAIQDASQFLSQLRALSNGAAVTADSGLDQVIDGGSAAWPAKPR